MSYSLNWSYYHYYFGHYKRGWQRVYAWYVMWWVMCCEGLCVIREVMRDVMWGFMRDKLWCDARKSTKTGEFMKKPLLTIAYSKFDAWGLFKFDSTTPGTGLSQPRLVPSNAVNDDDYHQHHIKLHHRHRKPWPHQSRTTIIITYTAVSAISTWRPCRVRHHHNVPTSPLKTPIALFTFL